MTNPLQIAAALRTLSDAGLAIHVPSAVRLEMVSVNQLAQLWDISPAKARSIINGLPRVVRLGGGDLRARVSDLEQYLESITTEAT